MDTSVFFHPDGGTGEAGRHRGTAAIAVCARCPVLAECAAYALAAGEPYGVWAGSPWPNGGGCWRSAGKTSPTRGDAVWTSPGCAPG